MKRKESWSLLIASLALVGFPADICASTFHENMKVKEGVPEGFAYLTLAQKGTADVFYNGVLVGRFPIEFTPSTIQFKDLDHLIPKLTMVKPQDAELVKQALTGEIPTNANLLCPKLAYGMVSYCGKLDPEVASVIFDESVFRADLFINAQLLDSQLHKGLLPPPTQTVFSGIHHLNGTITQATGEGDNQSLIQDSVLSYGAGRLSLVQMVSQEQTRLDSLRVGYDKDGLLYQGGLFDSHAESIVPTVKMVGVSVGTSLDTNLDLKQSSGNQLWLFLPNRSWVSLVYNNIVYSSNFYEAGNQLLDTANLPDGAYEVRLRIRDSSGDVHEEKRFFARNIQIPPPGRSIYYGSAGFLRDQQATGYLPDTKSIGVGQAGMIRRLSESVGWHGSLTMVDDRLYGESGLFWLFPPSQQLKFSALLSSVGDVGIAANYYVPSLYQKLTMSVDARRVWANRTIVNPRPEELIHHDYTQGSVLISYLLRSDLWLNLQGNLSDQSDSALRYAYGPSLRWDIWRHSGNSLTFFADTNETQDGLAANGYLQFAMQLGHWGASGGTGVHYQNQSTRSSSDNGVHPKADMRVYWSDVSRPGKYTEVGAETHVENGDVHHQIDGEYKGDLGRMRLLAEQTNVNGETRNLFNGSLGFSIAHSGTTIGWGGGQQQTSGIMLSSAGNTKDEKFNVLVNGSPRTELDSDHHGLLLLSPYETYKIAIVPQQKKLLDYTATRQEVTLYPGNVIPLSWDINHIQIVIGKLADETGQPIVGARLTDGNNLTITDQDGRFQAEVRELSMLHFELSQPAGQTCAIDVSQIKSQKQVVVIDEPVVCIQQ
ncbi:MAG: CS1-pili formation C-terminal domain-containing protein [Alphaproteobacteria bacterium]|nr:CS1-pili formation C-terminal domain-containing protein [Alphaproteobacteria bacterium]